MAKQEKPEDKMQRFPMLLAERDAVGALSSGRKELVRKLTGVDKVMGTYVGEARERLVGDAPGEFAWIEPVNPDGEWQWGFTPAPEKPQAPLLDLQREKLAEMQKGNGPAAPETETPTPTNGQGVTS